jgi:ATP-dependent Clp protease ATP-binding subunit ClpX
MKKELLECDFCGRPENDLTMLIAGPKSYICNDCILTCVNVVQYETKKKLRRAVKEYRHMFE